MWYLNCQLNVTNRTTPGKPHVKFMPLQMMTTPEKQYESLQVAGETIKWHFYHGSRGWSGSAMVLGKLPVPEHPTIWITVGQGPTGYCTCSRCGWVLFGHFYFYLSFLSSFSLSLGDGPI